MRIPRDGREVVIKSNRTFQQHLLRRATHQATPSQISSSIASSETTLPHQSHSELPSLTARCQPLHYPRRSLSLILCIPLNKDNHFLIWTFEPREPPLLGMYHTLLVVSGHFFVRYHLTHLLAPLWRPSLARLCIPLPSAPVDTTSSHILDRLSIKYPPVPVNPWPH